MLLDLPHVIMKRALRGLAPDRGTASRSQEPSSDPLGPLSSGQMKSEIPVSTLSDARNDSKIRVNTVTSPVASHFEPQLSGPQLVDWTG
jgi:hypothetical protein